MRTLKTLSVILVSALISQSALSEDLFDIPSSGNAVDPTSIIGVWEMQPFEAEYPSKDPGADWSGETGEMVPGTTVTRYRFKKDSMTFASKCITEDHGTLVAQVTFPATISLSRKVIIIKKTETPRQVVRNDKFVCIEQAELVGGSEFPFRVVDGKLYLDEAGSDGPFLSNKISN